MSYQAEARIICRVFGTKKNVTVAGREAAIQSHLTFNAMSITQRLFNVPPAAVDVVPDNDRAICFTKAKSYVQSELPVGYSVDDVKAVPIAGHALIGGRWVHIGGAAVSYAFPLRFNNEPIEDESLCKDASGNEQSLTLSWCVVIQPK